MRYMSAKKLCRPVSHFIIASFNAVSMSFSSIQGVLVYTLSHCIISTKQRSILIQHQKHMSKRCHFPYKPKDIRVFDKKICDVRLPNIIIF
jgi:hypothetical protein